MATTSKFQRIFSGIQPSGSAHLGNYLGALKNWVKLQSACDSVIYCIVDLHALTVPQAPFLLKKNVLDMTKCLLACGVDPNKSIVFQQSKVASHSELMWLLGCHTPMGWLKRMTQWKSKSATDNMDMINLGLYAYPVLMSADILLYRATHVPVGEDQLQHLELTRDISRSFNSKYKVDLFPEPQSLLGEVHRVMSLRNPLQKMSKSDNQEMSRINLSDSPDDIRNKIRKAVTDSNSEITYDPKARPGVSNLVSIYSAITELSRSDVVELFVGKETVELKDSLVEVLVEHLTPLRHELVRLDEDEGFIEEVLVRGAVTASERANQTMTLLRKTLGID